MIQSLYDSCATFSIFGTTKPVCLIVFLPSRSEQKSLLHNYFFQDSDHLLVFLSRSTFSTVRFPLQLRGKDTFQILLQKA